MSPLVFLLAVAKETFVGPRPTFYTPRYGGQSKRVLHGMFTRAWQFEQVDIFLWCDNFVSLSEEMEKYTWTAKTGQQGGKGGKAWQAGEGASLSAFPWPSASGIANGAD